MTEAGPTVKEVQKLVRQAGRTRPGATVGELSVRNLARQTAKDGSRARNDQNPDDYANNLGSKQN